MIGIPGLGPLDCSCLSFIPLGEDVADEVLRQYFVAGGDSPAAPALEENGIDFKVRLYSAGAEHRKFLRLDEIFENQASAGIFG